VTVTLHGYEHSVYSWIARLALREKGVGFDWVEVDPFAADVPEAYLALHPFQRVPVLVHDGFALYETGAIARYVDEAFPGPVLQPADPKVRARMSQIVSIVDSYAYWPLVRQVFSHAVFRPRLGGVPDPAELRKGLDAAPKVLRALDDLAGEDAFLVGASPSLADLHLAPMIAYFAAAEDGAALLAKHGRLSRWWSAMSRRPTVVETMPKVLRAPVSSA